MGENLKWEEIVKKYPDRWVAVKDYKLDGTKIVSGVVCSVCQEKDQTRETKRLLSQNIDAIWDRTTEVPEAFVV